MFIMYTVYIMLIPSTLPLSRVQYWLSGCSNHRFLRSSNRIMLSRYSSTITYNQHSIKNWNIWKGFGGFLWLTINSFSFILHFGISIHQQQHVGQNLQVATQDVHILCPQRNALVDTWHRWITAYTSCWLSNGAALQWNTLSLGSKERYTPANLTVATGIFHCHVRPYQRVGNLAPSLPRTTDWWWFTDQSPGFQALRGWLHFWYRFAMISLHFAVSYWAEDRKP